MYEHFWNTLYVKRENIYIYLRFFKCSLYHSFPSVTLKSSVFQGYEAIHPPTPPPQDLSLLHIHNWDVLSLTNEELKATI